MLTKGQLFLKPDEGRFLSLAVVAMIEQVEETRKNDKINWTPEARKDLSEIATAGNTLFAKLKKLGFDMRPLPPFLPGDEKDFLTKES